MPSVQAEPQWPTSYATVFSHAVPDEDFNEAVSDVAGIAECLNFWLPKVHAEQCARLGLHLPSCCVQCSLLVTKPVLRQRGSSTGSCRPHSLLSHSDGHSCVPASTAAQPFWMANRAGLNLPLMPLPSRK